MDINPSCWINYGDVFSGIRSRNNGHAFQEPIEDGGTGSINIRFIFYAYVRQYSGFLHLNGIDVDVAMEHDENITGVR